MYSGEKFAGTEVYDIAFEIDGLTAIADKLGCSFGDLLAFPTEAPVKDVSNNGARFRAIAQGLHPGSDSSGTVSTLKRRGFQISDKAVLTVYIRGPPRNSHVFQTPAPQQGGRPNIDSNGDTKKSDTQASNSRLSSATCAEVRRLVCAIYPRDERGVLLPERSNNSGIRKRPNWVAEVL